MMPRWGSLDVKYCDFAVMMSFFKNISLFQEKQTGKKQKQIQKITKKSWAETGVFYFREVYILHF